MKDNYDFSKARRGAVVKASGKTQITIMLDNDVLDAFRDRAAAEGNGYQTLINDALRETLTEDSERPCDLGHFTSGATGRVAPSGLGKC